MSGNCEGVVPEMQPGNLSSHSSFRNIHNQVFTVITGITKSNASEKAVAGMVIQYRNTHNTQFRAVH